MSSCLMRLGRRTRLPLNAALFSRHLSTPAASFAVNGDRLWKDIHDTAKWSAFSEGGLTRLCADDNDKKVRDWFREQAIAIGADYKVNTVGAQIAILPGKHNDIPPIAMGSHLDSVVTGGKFDGVLGVLSGLEVLRSFREQAIETHAPIAVINWTNEEGARFTPGLGASTVWAGVASVDDVLACKTHDDNVSLTMGEELARIGYIGTTPATSDEFPLSAHFEIHNEQNTELERAGKSVGWAPAWQGIAGYEVVLEGEDGHATTYAMERRQDALVGASRLIVAAEDTARELRGFATATKIRSGPWGFCNIQSKVALSWLIGHREQASFDKLCIGFEDAAHDVTGKYRLKLDLKKTVDLPVGRFTKEAVDCAANGVGDLGVAITCMSGHDSLMTMLKAPTAMLFVRSKGGYSHSPKEWSEKQDCADGALALGRTVLHYDDYLRRR